MGAAGSQRHLWEGKGREGKGRVRFPPTPRIPLPLKPGWRHCPRAGITAPGYAEAVLGEKCHGRKGGRAGGVLCGHNNENIIPDSWDVMGTLQTPQRTTARGGKKGRQKNKGK